MTASRRTDGTRTTLFLVFVLAAAAVAILQPNLAAAMKNVKATEDVYVLPPPEELKVATLGYSSASADMIWAQLLVEYGRHWAEKRPFPDLEKYLDAIIALDPSFSSVYRFVDTLLIFRPPRGTEEDARKARAYLERGLRERPYDKDVWLQYGQFVGFLAPSFLTAEDEKERWRIEGAEALIRAVELGAVLDRAISATSMLSRRGRRQAAVEYLERARALTDDPGSIAEIEARLSLLERDLVKDDASVARMVQRREVRNRLIDGRWRGELPFVSRGEFLLLGPLPNAFVCSGNDRRTRADCAPDWTAALNTLAP